ncbi:MAG: hypothetical protein AAGB33_00220 [Cellulomonas sp.]|nr:hypothetical protein [Rickettsiella sp.]
MKSIKARVKKYSLEELRAAKALCELHKQCQFFFKPIDSASVSSVSDKIYKPKPLRLLQP